jgi:hypothetical protein
MKISMKKITAAALFLGVAFQPLAASAQKITSSIFGDDEFKAFISTSPTSPGVEFAQGIGWSINFKNTLYLYPGTTAYFMHIWVRDLGGAPNGLLGEFTMAKANPRGCKFANNSVNLLTLAAKNYWTVSPTQAYSTPITGGPFSALGAPQFNNVIPAFAQATLPPVSLGTNAGPNPWPLPHPFVGVNASAEWLWSPKNQMKEAWFTTRITCKKPN